MCIYIKDLKFKWLVLLEDTNMEKITRVSDKMYL